MYSCSSMLLLLFVTTTRNLPRQNRRQSQQQEHHHTLPPPTQDARRAVMVKAEDELAEAERGFAEERDRLLEEAEAAAAVSATQVQIIEELRALETGTRRELEKARQEAEQRESKMTDLILATLHVSSCMCSFGTMLHRLTSSGGADAGWVAVRRARSVFPKRDDTDH